MLTVTDWPTIERTFSYVDAMAACIQDPIHHAEGDVWTHTKMVSDALAQFNCADRIGRLTALYHDVAKPATRVEGYNINQNRITVSHPDHARKGAAIAWHDLWLANESLPIRLAVHWLCRWHMRPSHLWEQQDMARVALQFSCLGSWHQLLNFARADTTGRRSQTQQTALDNLALLEEWLQEYGYSTTFWTHDHDRVFYFEKAGRSPLFHAQPAAGSRVIMLCGLPGVGKDTYIKTNLADWPVVSLDAIRHDLRIAPDDNQGRVVQTAFATMRNYLRAKQRFVWNAQCITQLARNKIIRLCRAYDAHVTIHAFDRSLPTILSQNLMREHQQQVPESVILTAAMKWEPPSLLEAHQVVWV